MPLTTNRTFWPTTGGAIAFQPGMGLNHATTFVYINLGYGTDGFQLGPKGAPPNMSSPMVPPFQILGPSNHTYPGTVCLPHAPLPAHAYIKAGDNATIQLIELGAQGGALYSVRASSPLFTPQPPFQTEVLIFSGCTVRRHHLCRARRPAYPPRQRDQLL